MTKRWALLALVSVLPGCASLRTLPVPRDVDAGDAAIILWLARGAESDLSVFGEAEGAAARYFVHWRKHFQRGPGRHAEEIAKAGRGDWGKGFAASLAKHYTLGDFREAVAILHDRLPSLADSKARERLQQLIITHDCAELTFVALAYENVPDDEGTKKMAEEARRRLAAIKQDSGKLLLSE